MPEIIGLDHIYIAVSNLERSERFYDAAFLTLGFRKNTFPIDGDPHVQYFNRHFGYVLRPAKTQRPHDPYSPGLHHLCLRVNSKADVDSAAELLRQAGLEVSGPNSYPQYAHDYVAIFLSDPDGVRLEVTNYREERRARHDNW